MHRLLTRFQQSELLRHVGTLASGTLIAQVILLGSSPVLTRVYGPESFAMLALFMAFISAIAPGVSGRYEVAIVVAKTPEDSRSFLVISVWIAAAVSAGIAVSLFAFFEPISAFLNAGSLGRWLMLVPLGLFLFGVTTAMRYFANSRKDYATISRLAIGQAFVTTVVSILFGVISVPLPGLVAATLLGFGFAAVYMGCAYWRELGGLSQRLDPVRRALALRYKDFPLYNASTSILDGFTLSMAVFFLTKHYPEAVVGYYALLNRVAAAPLGFISQAVSQVHLKKVAELVQSGNSVKPYLKRISLALVAIVSVPTVIFMLAAPPLFAIVFGDAWREAGELLVILMPAIAVKFVVSTLSGVFASTGNNHLSAVWKVTAFVVTLAMFQAFSGTLGVRSIFVAMMVTDIALYLFYYYLIWKAIRHSRGNA